MATLPQSYCKNPGCRAFLQIGPLRGQFCSWCRQVVEVVNPALNNSQQGNSGGLGYCGGLQGSAVQFPLPQDTANVFNYPQMGGTLGQTAQFAFPQNAANVSHDALLASQTGRAQDAAAQFPYSQNAANALNQPMGALQGPACPTTQFGLDQPQPAMQAASTFWSGQAPQIHQGLNPNLNTIGTDANLHTTPNFPPDLRHPATKTTYRGSLGGPQQLGQGPPAGHGQQENRKVRPPKKKNKQNHPERRNSQSRNGKFASVPQGIPQRQQDEDAYQGDTKRVKLEPGASSRPAQQPQSPDNERRSESAWCLRCSCPGHWMESCRHPATFQVRFPQRPSAWSAYYTDEEVRPAQSQTFLDAMRLLHELITHLREIDRWIAQRDAIIARVCISLSMTVGEDAESERLQLMANCSTASWHLVRDIDQILRKWEKTSVIEPVAAMMDNDPTQKRTTPQEGQLVWTRDEVAKYINVLRDDPLNSTFNAASANADLVKEFGRILRQYRRRRARYVLDAEELSKRIPQGRLAGLLKKTVLTPVEFMLQIPDDGIAIGKALLPLTPSGTILKDWDTLLDQAKAHPA